MQNDICKITGPVYPVITPFDKNGDIDYVSLENYVKFLLKNEAKTIYVMAHSSRLGLLSDAEIKEVNNYIIHIVKSNTEDTIVIAATPIHGSTKNISITARDILINGADFVSILFSERYYSNEQVVEFYKEISDVACGNILVHEEGLSAKRGCEKVPWSDSLLNKVMAIEGIVALKEDSHNDIQTECILEKYSDSHNIILAGGGKAQFYKHVPTAKAYLVGVGSFIPHAAEIFYQQYLEGNYPFCQSFIEEVESPFFHVAFDVGWYIALKSAMEHVGIMSRYERRPLMELDLVDHVKVGKATEHAVTAANRLIYRGIRC